MTIINPSSAVPKLSAEKVKKGYFLCFGNNVRMYIYWDPSQPYGVKHCYHATIEDIQTFSHLEKVVFSVTSSIPVTPSSPPSDVPSLASESNDHHQLVVSPSINSTTTKHHLISPTNLLVSLPPPHLDTSSTPSATPSVEPLPIINDAYSCCQHFTTRPTGFPGKDIYSVQFTLPPPTSSIGLHLLNDPHYHLPYIKSTVRNSVAYNNIPSSIRTNHFILAINGDSPITAARAEMQLKAIQSTPDRVAVIDLVHRGHAETRTSLYATRAIFDSLPAYLLNNPTINSAHVYCE